MATLGALRKDWTQSASPTGGITSYGKTGKVRLRAKVRKNAVDLLELLKVRRP